MKKILLFLLLMLFLSVEAFEKSDLYISYDTTKISNNIFRCDLLISLPKGWKLAQAPSISVLKTKNLKNFVYSNKQSMEKLSDTTYKTYFQIEIKNTKDLENELVLSISCPICNDICTIITKDLIVHFDKYSVQDINDNSLLLSILFAVVGGLILNVMPCVLPVILMKLQSFAASNNKSAILGSIAGNYISFLVLAVFLAILKSGGEVIGWGTHLQNINFLKFSVAILFFFVLYSFEIISISPSMQLKVESRRLFVQNFISSIIASIIAIPCTAPFLGAAATFAIQGSMREMFIVFSAIATGFSMPYIFALIFSIVIPKNLGKLSVSVKKIINCGVLIAFLWMFFLLCNHISALTIILYCIVFIVCTLLLKKGQKIPAVFLALAIFIMPSDKKIAYIDNSNQLLWKRHENINDILDIIDDHVKKEKIVILNISADWCLTCKYNKIAVLNNKQIIKVIKDKDIACIEGDMTKKNDQLMRFINDHNRVGIPFTIIYGPGAKEGILLSEIPTIDDVLNAIKQVEK